MKTLDPKTERRLDIQGFDGIDRELLAEIAPWQRLAFSLCTLFAASGTALGSPALLWALVPIAALAAIFPVHPFDLLYNHGVRYMTRTRPLPKRGAPARFACGVGAVWLVATAVAFQLGATATGYALGGLLVVVALLVSTMDICIPSLAYRSILGFPPKARADTD
jgi:hypothetical protein